MRISALVVAVTVLLAGCSTSTTPDAEPKKKEPEKIVPLSGKSAFFRMYPSARQWAMDAKGIQLTSMQIKEAPAEPGKAGVWRAVFVSESRGKMKSFTWSAVDSEPNLRQGVYSNQEEAFTGRIGQATPFFTQALTKDSDEAYQVALGKDDPFLKTNPKDSINFLLEQTPRSQGLAWRVIWGESVGTAKYSVFVDATTGKFLAKDR